jgi:FkbM family methyltransferase
MEFNKLKTLDIKSYLDVGTNNAQFFTEIIKIFPNIYTEFVEPNPHCNKKIAKRYKHIIMHPVGLGEAKGSLTFYINKFKSSSKGASFIRDTNIEVNEITVDVKTLDSITQDKVFDFIKIDVEGFELEVLKGGVNTLSKTRYLLVEMSPDSSVINWLEDHNYTLIDILENHFYKKELIKIDGLFERNSTSAKFDIIKVQNENK